MTDYILDEAVYSGTMTSTVSTVYMFWGDEKW